MTETTNQGGTKIQWTDRTWNPTVGCSKVSEGCRNCYAIKDAHRLAGNPNPKIRDAYAGLTERRGDRTEWTGQVNFLPDRLDTPLRVRKPTRWFVNSMSDLFHEAVTDAQIDQVFAAMSKSPQHVFQILTKRPERMLEYFKQLEKRLITGSPHGRGWNYLSEAECTLANLYWYNFDRPIGHFFPLRHVWLGVSVENQKAADDRIPLLLQTPAAVRFLSCEPLLGEVDLTNICWSQAPEGWRFDVLHGKYGIPASWSADAKTVDWVICGGESGHQARPCHIQWLRSLVGQCQLAEIPVFVKQLGANVQPPALGQSDRKGDEFAKFPADLQVREFPLRIGEDICD